MEKGGRGGAATELPVHTTAPDKVEAMGLQVSGIPEPGPSLATIICTYVLLQKF